MKLLCFALWATINSMLCAIAAPDANKDSSEHDKIMVAMDGMIFKKIELKNATIDEAVRLLTEESKKSDPEHQGIRFVVHAPSPRPPASITLDEQNASLKTVLKKIQQQTGYAYTVGDAVLYVWYDNGEGLTRRTFTVPSGFFEIKPEQSPQSFYDVKPQLAAKGIHFPVGRSAQYQPSQRQLIVTADPDQLEDIDDLLFNFSQQRK
jgi:hypothetical protein